jgi:hypothetical protein
MINGAMEAYQDHYLGRTTVEVNGREVEVSRFEDRIVWQEDEGWTVLKKDAIKVEEEGFEKTYYWIAASGFRVDFDGRIASCLSDINNNDIVDEN